MRSAIGGLYAWRASIAENLEDRQRMMVEADFAFRQAFAFAPHSPEAVFRYVNLLLVDGRIEDALEVAGVAQSLDSDNVQLSGLISELTRIKRTTGK